MSCIFVLVALAWSLSTGAVQQRTDIPGVTSGDLTTQFKKRGMSCEGPRTMQGGGGSWICRVADATGEYSIEFSGRPARIEYITGTVMQFGAVSAAKRDQFLSYIASLPYDGSNPAQAQSWAKQNGGKNTETVIGGIKLRISGPARARSVSLFRVGSGWDK